LSLHIKSHNLLRVSEQKLNSKTMIRFYQILVAAAASTLFVSFPSASANVDDAVVLSSYHVSTNVNSRLATTSIDMVFENSQDCTSAYGMAIQLPVDARVTELVMNLSDGCQMESTVKNLDQAVEDFEEFYEEGKAAAILTAWDMSNYELQVSIPPNGTTSVTLNFQELLVQKLDQVSFQVPMFPGMAVDDLTIDVSVEDVNMVNEFETDFQDERIVTSLEGGMASMHYEKREVTEATVLPTLFRANFKPGLPPEEGLFLSDGECFTHIFNPALFLSTTGSMARKIVFVIDVSGSMDGQKLQDVKASFVLMIETLEERDILVIQTFSNEGTEEKFGPFSATDFHKNKAKNFVKGLITIGGTNLNDAYLDGIKNAKDTLPNVVPVVVMMTDGQGSKSASEIVRNVRESNEGRMVKIFSLAFGNGADYELLNGIAIQNGGRAVRIYEGFGDASNQMEQFYKQELGSILMSDINVNYDFGDIGVSDSTVSSFPILAGGSEIVVRGKMDSSTLMDSSSRSLKSIVSANSANGPVEWPVDYNLIPDANSGSDCRQSFAQARIVELLEYRDATEYIGDEFLVGTAVSRSINLNASSFEEQARKVALDAGLVWPGLTALVTVESANCRQNSSDVCYSGFERGNEFDGDKFDTGRANPSRARPSGGGYYSSGASKGSRCGSIWQHEFGLISLVLVTSGSMMMMILL